MGNERFYADLPTRIMRVSELVADESRFAPVPPDWEVILTDVRDRRDAHIHFVDGLDGGYTRAATILKKKMVTALAAGPGA